MQIDHLAFRIGSKLGKHPLSGRIFCSLERLLPLKRLGRKHGLVAFWHPRPIANTHILIVPTSPIPSLTSTRIADGNFATLLWKMMMFVTEIEEQLGHGVTHRLVINGGSRQDIGQLHAHLLVAETTTKDPDWTLRDPAVHVCGWKNLRSTLQHAEHASKGGFSLTLQWISDAEIAAKVMRDT